MQALFVALYFVLAFILYFLLLGRYKLTHDEDNKEMEFGLTCIIACIFMTVWPIVILGCEARFLGRKFFDKKDG